MKNLLVMGVTGVGLFSATVVGLLGVQGRLNHEGTKGIPVLNSFFSPPPAAAEGEAGKDAETGGHGAAGREQDSEPTGAHGTDQKGATHGAKPGKPKIEYVTGKSINEPEPAADDGHGGGGEAPAGDGHGDDAHGEPNKPKRTPTRADEQDPEKIRQAELRRKFDRQKEWLHSRDAGYRGPGDLFEMPRIKAGMSVEEINSVVQRAQRLLKDVETERAVLDKRRRDLDVRQRDIADRQARVSRLMNQVEAERTKIEQTIEDFNKRVRLIQPQEEAGLKVIASTVASLSPEAAKDLILNYWRTEDGQDKAVRILTFMEKDKVDVIIAQMETEKMREILERRMTYVRAPAKK